MTLLIAWIGADVKKEGKRVGSIYIAADSRYSWAAGDTYDSGLKVFGCTRFPEIFGFCGDVTFGSNTLTQLTNQIDRGVLFSDDDSHEEKNKKIFNYIKSAIEQYPRSAMREGFSICHGTRVKNKFYFFRTSGKKSGFVNNFEIILPNMSQTIYSEGAGKTEFDNNLYKWEQERHNNFGTSRAVYHCLVETLTKIKKTHTGGKPQIVGLYREGKGNSIAYGILHDGVRYINGVASSQNPSQENIEWRNELFERIDPNTLKLISGAQRQPK